MKPNHRIYQTLLQKLKLTSAEVVFVDDKLENIKGAKKCGIKAIRFTNYKDLRVKLRKLIII